MDTENTNKHLVLAGFIETAISNDASKDVEYVELDEGQARLVSEASNEGFFVTVGFDLVEKTVDTLGAYNEARSNNGYLERKSKDGRNRPSFKDRFLGARSGALARLNSKRDKALSDG